jgi:hypothetical protein
MLEMTYTKQHDEQICRHEESTLIKYEQYLEKFGPVLQEYGCTIKTGLWWTNSLAKSGSYHREELKNGYECYVYFAIEKNGETVRIPSDDGEADYYLLSMSYMISAINRRWWKLNIQLFPDVDEDINSDMNKFISMLCKSQRLFQ